MSRELTLKAFHSAMRDAFALRGRHADGDYSPDLKAARFPSPEEAFPPHEAPTPSRRKGVSLSDLLEGWWVEGKARNLAISTYESYARTIRQFQAFIGHDDAGDVTPENIIAFKDHRIAEGKSPKTVLDSDLAALRAIFDWAVTNRRIPSNPAVGVKLRRGKDVRTRGKEFTAAEAKAILGQSSNYEAATRERPGIAAAKRWAPWLCAYTGARIGEIVQLRKEDIRREGDVWAIKITPEAGSQKDHMRRDVMLHRHLTELGFPEFVEHSRDGYLFLNVKSGGDIRGPWRTAKNRITTFVRRVVTDKGVAPNHGWRHLFKTIGREAGIEDSVLDGICGHAQPTEGRKYGSVPIPVQIAAFAKFPRFVI